MKKTFVCIALALLGNTAMAADSGWYVGGDLGSTKFKADGGSLRKTGMGVFGGFKFNANLAVEGAFHRLGTLDCAADDCGVHALSVSLIARAPLSDNFSLYGRLGYGRNSLDIVDGSTVESAHKSKALIGAGAEFHFNQHFSLRGEFTNRGNNEGLKIEQFNLGLTYSF